MTKEELATSEIIIARQRNGPTDTVFLNFLSQFTRFDNPDVGHDFWCVLPRALL